MLVTVIEVIGGTLVPVLGFWLAYQQYQISKRQETYERVADQTRVLANSNNNILESWMQTAQELRAELNGCRKSEAELRTRMSGLETKLATYRNVAFRGWPLKIVEQSAETQQEPNEGE